MNHESIIKENRWYINKRSGQVWKLNWIDYEDGQLVMIKGGGRPLTKVISIKNFEKNWEVREDLSK